MIDSSFLRNLIGTDVRIVCKHAGTAVDVPPLVLREISALGVVGENHEGLHFFPWPEVAEISPCPVAVDEDTLSAVFCADSEP